MTNRNKQKRLNKLKEKVQKSEQEFEVLKKVLSNLRKQKEKKLKTIENSRLQALEAKLNKND